ncbi:MAG: GIY-YIG nuclease family protein [Anaerolineae bacterium]
MPSHIYILKCADGSYHTGSTKDIARRLWQRQNGKGANYTKKRLPVKLVYCEPFDRVEDAFRREKQVQGWSRRKKQALIAGNYDKLIEFSRNYTQYGNPATASTSSASAYVFDSERPSGSAHKPPPELEVGELS